MEWVALIACESYMTVSDFCRARYPSVYVTESNGEKGWHVYQIKQLGWSTDAASWITKKVSRMLQILSFVEENRTKVQSAHLHLFESDKGLAEHPGPVELFRMVGRILSIAIRS